MRVGSLPLLRSSGGKTNGHNDTIQPAILDVCPANDSKEMDVQKENFNVVQKVKALEAFKSLDNDREFNDLYGGPLPMSKRRAVERPMQWSQ